MPITLTLKSKYARSSSVWRFPNRPSEKIVQRGGARYSFGCSVIIVVLRRLWLKGLMDHARCLTRIAFPLDSVRGLYASFASGISGFRAYSVYSYARLFGSETFVIQTCCGGSEITKFCEQFFRLSPRPKFHFLSFARLTLLITLLIREACVI